MRILYVCTALRSHGGIQRFNRFLVDAWLQLGIQVDAVSVNDPPEPPDAATNLLRVHGADGSKLRWAGTVARLLVQYRYDAIVCGHINLAPALVSLSLPLARGRPRRTLFAYGIEIWDRVVGAKRLASRHFDQVLAISRYTAQSFSQQMPSFPNERVVIFPLTIDPALQAHKPRRRELQGSTDTPFQLVSVSRLARSERDKGIVHVLEALSGAQMERGFRYVIVGDGDDRDWLQARAVELRISDRVSFQGALSDRDLWTELERADAFVLPSGKEGFGIVFLEAMLFGLPVIAAAEKGALDVVRHGENGLLVPFADVCALRHSLLALASNAHLAWQLGHAGRALVEPGGEFSYLAFVERCGRAFGRAMP